MYKRMFVLIVTVLLIGSYSQAEAQMMGDGNPSVTVDPTQIQEQQKEEVQGKEFFDQLQNKQITCEKLTDSNFEKIGEYVMSQMFGSNTNSHIAMNERIQQMRGQTGEEQMHSQIGRSVTGCSMTTSQSNTANGGGLSMMGWNGFGMMSGAYGLGGGFGIVGIIIHTLIVVDLILLGIWLWKHIKMK